MTRSVHLAQQAEEYDAIVVGSGMSGGVAAKELTERGYRTLVLERGRPLQHGAYPMEWKAPWELPNRNLVSPEVAEEHYVQNRNYLLRQETLPYLMNDREVPYIEDKPFTWMRANVVGGRSLLWGRQCYRWSEMDFEANARDGFGVDWPIRYADIAPWYDHVEPYVGISGEALGLQQLPDSRFLPPMAMNAVEQRVREGIQRAFSDRVMTIGRVANLSQGINGRSHCQYRNQCWRGCSYRAYFSSTGVTLPMAEATGNLTLRPNSIVHSVIYDEARGRATGVRVIDAETKQMEEYYGKVVFLCASALGTTQILLNSTSNRFPNGLGNDSGVLGHYLMDHHFRVGASGEMPGFEDRYYYGRRPNGIYIPRFRNLPWDRRTRHADFVRGYGYQGSAFRPGWARGMSPNLPAYGADLKHALREPGPWVMSLVAFGETLPRHENRVYLDPNETDAYGMPVLRIDCAWGENELAMRKDMAEQAAEMLEAAGCRNIVTYDLYTPGGYGAEPGLGIHEMGTARMGRDPSTSVLNAHNQLHAVPNVFVTDGACMTSSACQNPSITYMALTARAVAYMDEEVKRRNL
ncbi:GMC family oxidoreductase [Rhodothermaceae bacterium RA]|nr:GMC family oxidoreductase [Rhodothermaceae bacterium RA]